MKHIDTPLVIGIAGIMGCGKSTVAGVFAQLGAKVIDADALGKELLRDAEIRQGLVQTFGPGVRGKSGQIDTVKLGALAFRNEECARKLDRLTGKALICRIRSRIRQLRASAGLVVVDAALLPEWGAKAWLDLVLVVDADEEISLRRTCGDSRFCRANARRRMRHQLPRIQKSGYADLIIPNYGSLQELRRRARSVFWILVGLAVTRG